MYCHHVRRPSRREDLTPKFHVTCIPNAVVSNAVWGNFPFWWYPPNLVVKIISHRFWATEKNPCFNHATAWWPGMARTVDPRFNILEKAGARGISVEPRPDSLGMDQHVLSIECMKKVHSR